jgi:hypothetical protein
MWPGCLQRKQRPWALSCSRFSKVTFVRGVDARTKEFGSMVALVGAGVAVFLTGFGVNGVESVVRVTVRVKGREKDT